MTKAEITSNPFLWKDKPSILSVDHEFNGVNHGKSVAATKQFRQSPVSLPGGSKNLAPDMMRKPK